MTDAYLRRIACQIATQLPDDEKQAFTVLCLVRQIVENLGGGWAASSCAIPTRLFAVPPTGLEESPTTEMEGQNGPPGKANPK